MEEFEIQKKLKKYYEIFYLMTSMLYDKLLLTNELIRKY